MRAGSRGAAAQKHKDRIALVAIRSLIRFQRT